MNCATENSQIMRELLDILSQTEDHHKIKS